MIRSNNGDNIDMKVLRDNSIFITWILSVILFTIHILSIFLIPTQLHLVTVWLSSGLGLFPILISTTVFFKMSRDLKQNQVQSIADEALDLRRIEILQSGHQPYRDAEDIFTGKTKVNIVVSRWDIMQCN